MTVRVATPHIVPIESHGDVRETRARLVLGDALDVARALEGEGLAGQVDLVYVDPPFASQAGYVHEARSTGRRTGASCGRRRTTTAGRGELSELPRHARAAPRGAGAPAATRRDALGAPRLARVVSRAAAARRDPRARRVRQRDRLAARAEPRAAGREPAVRAYARHARRLRRDRRRRSCRRRASSPSSRAPSGGTTRGGPSRRAPRGDYTDASIARLEQEGRVHRTACGQAST